MQTSNRMKAVARKSNKISVFIIVAICVCLGIALLIAKGNLHSRNTVYAAQEEQIRTQIEGESSRALELDEYEKYVKSDEFAERMAREKFGLVGEGEYAIKAEN